MSLCGCNGCRDGQHLTGAGGFAFGGPPGLDGGLDPEGPDGPPGFGASSASRRAPVPFSDSILK